MMIPARIERRLRAYAFKQAKIDRLINRLAVIRLLVFLGLVLGVSLLFGQATLQVGGLITFLCTGLFLYLMVRHDRCYRFKQQCLTLSDILGQDLARATYRPGDVKIVNPIAFEPGHPFAHDLDISGPNGLMALVDNCHHLAAKEWLSSWVNSTPPAVEIEARQNAVAALSPRKRFRLKLTLASTLGSQPTLHPLQFQNWLQTASPWTLTWPALLIGRVWTAVTLVTLIGRFAFGMDQWPWLYILLVQIGIFYGFDYLHRHYLLGFLEHGKALEAAKAILKPFQSLRTTAGSLNAIQGRLQGENHHAGEALSKLHAIFEQLSFRENGLGHFLINTLFMWDQFHLKRLDQWRKTYGGQLSDWITCMFEVEALSAVANMKWLFPGRPFPKILDEGTLHIEAEGLGHPSIPEEHRVSNPFTLLGGGKVHLITGSNMSGKSTFLRAIGANQILARLGAPVCARRLTTHLPLLWTSIRIQDSLAEGVSYFYAEVKRLKALLDAVTTSERPVLFLLDEILKGTNSRERLIACKALVKFLIAHKASGLITTHDLELLALAAEHPDAITKFHFQEQVRDDAMFFDYQIKPGELTSTNALRVMKYAGVPLDFEPDS